MTPQEKLEALQNRSAILDAKYRNGKWWVRAVWELRPRNSDKKSDVNEATGDTLEACLDQLLA